MHWRSGVAGGGQVRVRLLLPGRRGTRVRQLQEKLLEAGFNPGPIDGVYGLLTVAAVQELQRAFGLREDGLAGPEVWSALSDPEARALRPLVRLQPGERLETVAARWRIDPAALRGFNGLPPATAPAGGDSMRVPATYRLAWPRPRTRAEASPGRAGGWSRALLTASIPHLSGLVTCVLTPKATAEPPDQTRGVDGAADPKSISPFVDVELVPLADLPEQAESVGCDRWALLPARDAHDLALALALSLSTEGGGKQIHRTDRMSTRRRLVVADPRLGDVDGILVDASGFRLPAQLPDLLGLLGDLQRLVGGQVERRRRLEVVLPSIPAAGRPFWLAFGQVCTRLAGRVDRLWLSGFRRPDDFCVAGRPLHLAELERMLAIARETWVPWRLGLVLPAGGWWADGRPLGRQEALALRRRDRMRLALASPAAAGAGARDPGRRDDASGLVMLGNGGPDPREADAAPEGYLVDQDTWRGVLRLAQQAGVGGLAVHPWGEEHPSLWEVLPEFSGRLGGGREASPGTGSI